MSQPVIEVRNLSKKYRLGSIGVGTLREEVERFFKKIKAPGAAGPAPGDFWALKDASFEVRRGEALGIIGRNGAGKSTLLKILSRITEPTSGEAILRGRTASLLEVGTGFHPELTGRENIYLNGAILGMRRREISLRLDEIIYFSGVEKHIDTPVKRYSSGMYVRLAFAVAAHLQPEILIVDEVLAVGDSEFQKKCIGKMREAASQHGRTVLFVSHDLAAVTKLTQRCVVMDAGRVAFIGPTFEATQHYLGSNRQSGDYSAPPQAPNHPHLQTVRLLTSEKGSTQAHGKPMTVEFQVRHDQPITGACLSFQIINQYQQPATHSWVYSDERPFARHPGTTTLSCTLPNIHLNVGHYTLKAFLSEPPGGRVFDVVENICPFEVLRMGDTTLWGWRPDACVYHEESEWEISRP